jgi:hypothetical protein
MTVRALPGVVIPVLMALAPRPAAAQPPTTADPPLQLPAPAAAAPALDPTLAGPDAVPSPAPGPGARDGPAVWGVVGLRGYAFDQQIAPNGLEYHALFTIDMNFNLWLWRSERVYLFSDTAFWGQRAAPGITNPTQGAFDFSKREFDLSAGLAWNYYGPLEARVFAYSFNNLNRGVSPNQPSGYADGVGLESRYYLGAAYADLGTAAFDVARTPFVGVGYYPTKDLVDADGNHFQPGPFARAYFTLDLFSPRWYLYADTQFVGTRRFNLELIKVDAGLAARPWAAAPRLELRLGSGNIFDPHSGEMETSVYGQVRFVY